jgi:hypothetical protein
MKYKDTNNMKNLGNITLPKAHNASITKFKDIVMAEMEARI